MTTTITEEFDGDGKLTKRTTVTDGYATGGYVQPFGGQLYPSAACTCCQPWGSITAPPRCPVHGQAQSATITCSSDTSPQQIAEQVAWVLRSAA